MRWRPNRTANTFPQVTLEEKTVYLVPVAVRKEGEHERAIITNETFLAERRSKWAMPPGTSTWKLSVRYGEVKTESPHAYLLKVPPVGRSNGHFTLEVRYDADIG